jgi:hypothetical protein
MSESEENSLNTKLKALEASLASLAPRDDRLNRERLVFLAGRASVGGPIEAGGQNPRARLESAAWPAAFAGMTVLAATLLVMIVTRQVNEPQVVHYPDTETQASATRTLIATAKSSHSRVISTGDARRHDIEQLLSVASVAASSNAASPSLVEGDRAKLTPATWREVLESAELMLPRPNDSSNIDSRVFQGATS